MGTGCESHTLGQLNHGSLEQWARFLACRAFEEEEARLKGDQESRVEQLGEERLPGQVAPFDFRFKGEA